MVTRDRIRVSSDLIGRREIMLRVWSLKFITVETARRAPQHDKIPLRSPPFFSDLGNVDCLPSKSFLLICNERDRWLLHLKQSRLVCFSSAWCAHMIYLFWKSTTYRLHGATLYSAVQSSRYHFLWDVLAQAQISVSCLQIHHDLAVLHWTWIAGLTRCRYSFLLN